MASLTPSVVAAYVVLLAWVMSVGYAMATADYGALQYVTPVMLLACGYLFGIKIVRNGKKNGGGE